MSDRLRPARIGLSVAAHGRRRERRHNRYVLATRNPLVTGRGEDGGGADASGRDDVPVPTGVTGDDRWELVETDETSFGDARLATVRSRRALYGDRRLRERVRAATGHDRLWRSVFVARLTTEPPLTPGVAGLVVRSVAFPRARSRFRDDLADRGVRAVEEVERRRIDVGRQRARAARLSAVVPVDDATVSAGARTDDDGVAVDAWIALWHREREMVAAGGFYPVAALSGAPDAFEPPGAYRERLFEFVRAVSEE